MSVVAGTVAVLLGVGMTPAVASSPARDAAPRAHKATTTLQGFRKAPASVLIPATVTDAVTVRPRAHRVVRVQARKPGSKVFVTVSSGFSDKHGDFGAVYRPTKAGAWQFRLFLPATARATSLVSASRKVVARLDTTAPGPVTAVNVAQGVGSELSLSWTNPTDADFAGVMIRRLVGATAPSATQGTLVTTTNAAATSFTDQTLAGDTTYSYALFAFDAVKNKAAGATRTVTSGAATTASLSLNGSSGATAKQTVGQSQAFDVSGSHAGRTLTVVSGTLDYGDGTPVEAFLGDPSTWVPTPHQYDVTGPVTAKLTVVDSASKTVTTSLVVTVFAAPTVTATVTSIDFEKGQPITFAVTSATPAGTSFTDFDTFSDGGNDFVSGAGAPPATFTITFPNAGTHTVTVEGFTDAGGLATVTIEVVIVDAPPPTP
jgi:hypothetical protein